MKQIKHIIAATLVAALTGTGFAGPKPEWVADEHKRIAALPPEAAKQACVFDIFCNRGKGVCTCGEEVGFSVRVKYKDGTYVPYGDVSVKVTDFGNTVLHEAVYNLETCKVYNVTTKLDKPGFIHFVVRRTAADGRVEQGIWAVGCDPEKIGPGSERPADFDAFWNDAIAGLDKTVPVDAKCVKDERASDEKHSCYRLSVASHNGRRTWGFLTVPNAPGKYPVKVNVPGAGEGCWSFPPPGSRPMDVRLTINVFDFEPGVTREEHLKRYNDMGDRWEKKYAVRGSWRGAWAAGIGVSREDYFYYGAILGANRLLNWVCAQPYADQSQVEYRGQSQGGGFGLYLAGLNRFITRATISEPALTGLLADERDGHRPGWPYVVSCQTTDEAKTNARRFAPYFDGAHFAARIRCQVRMGVGFCDWVCPPHCVYAAYNALKPGIGKRIVPRVLHLHNGPCGRAVPLRRNRYLHDAAAFPLRHGVGLRGRLEHRPSEPRPFPDRLFDLEDVYRLGETR